jgi:hypothetical protein
MSKTIYTPRDELWTACQRASYVNLVKRAAAGTPSFRDLAWLNTALDALDLTHMDYELDVASIEAGNTPPRMRGEWEKLEPIVNRDINDSGIVPIR